MTGTLQEMFERIERLPNPVQTEVTARIRELLDEKEIKSRKGVWSVRIDGGYRAMGRRQADQITWFWIGGHDEYLRLIGKK